MNKKVTKVLYAWHKSVNKPTQANVEVLVDDETDVSDKLILKWAKNKFKDYYGFYIKKFNLNDKPEDLANMFRRIVK